MVLLSAELVKRLAHHGAGNQPVITLYLNVDGRENIRPEDYRHRLESMIKDAMATAEPEAAIDLQRIVDFVTNDFERGNTRGLAIFVSGSDLWEVVTLTLPVEDHLIVNRTPHLRYLETLLDEYETTGVLMTDKQKARLFVIELGQIVERAQVIDPLPRHDDDGGDWEKDHVKTHSNEIAHQHLKHAAQAMFELYQRRHFDHLVVAVSQETEPELCNYLHDYLKQKMVGRTNLPITATDTDIVAAAHKLTQEKERANERMYIDKLRASVVTDDQGHRMPTEASANAVAGLEETLQAVFDKRVDMLLVSEGYSAPGWRCHQCNNIAVIGSTCKVCGNTMTMVDDVVEEAVEDAIGQNCKVEFCVDSADLDVMGRIGALLRF